MGNQIRNNRIKEIFLLLKLTFFLPTPPPLPPVQVSAHSDINKMTNTNLAVVFGPNLLWAKDAAITLKAINPINTFTKFLLDNQKELFENMEAWPTPVWAHHVSTVTTFFSVPPPFLFYLVLEPWPNLWKLQMMSRVKEGCGDGTVKEIHVLWEMIKWGGKLASPSMWKEPCYGCIGDVSSQDALKC